MCEADVRDSASLHKPTVLIYMPASYPCLQPLAEAVAGALRQQQHAQPAEH